MPQVNDIRHVHLLALAAASLMTLTGCAGHGKYTQAFKDESTRNMELIRAATDYDLAHQHYASGDHGIALEAIENSIALNPTIPRAHLLKGKILIEMSRLHDAIDALDRGRSLDPQEAEFSYYRAVALEQIGRPAEALDAYRQAIELAPRTPQYVLPAAEILIDLGRREEAIALLDRPESEFQSNAGFRQSLGHIAMMEDRIDDAVRFFSEAAVLSPDDMVLREDLCRAQIAASRFAEAEATLQRIARDARSADRRDLKQLHASCLLELDRPVEARRLLMELTRTAEGIFDVEAWVKLVDVAMMLGDDDLLRQVAGRLIAAVPERHEGYLAMAMWQRHQGDLPGAMRSLEIASRRAPEEPATLRLQSLILHQMAGQAAVPTG